VPAKFRWEAGVRWQTFHRKSVAARPETRFGVSPWASLP
jgi:hypothetical protein